MTRREYKGGAARLTLSSGINATDLTIATTGTATGWPTGGTGKFLAVVDRGNAGEEKVLVLSRSGNTLTIASTGDRGADNTAAASHSSGVYVEHVVGALDLDEPNAHINTTGQDDHTQYLNVTRHDADDHSAIFTAAPGYGAWTTYSPTVTQSGTVTNTVAYSRYFRVGRLVVYSFSVAITGTGSAGNAVTVSLPVTAAQAGNLVSGYGQVFDASANISYNGLVVLNTTTTLAMVATTNTTAQFLGIAGFTAALASTDGISCMVTYEAAT